MIASLEAADIQSTIHIGDLMAAAFPRSITAGWHRCPESSTPPDGGADILAVSRKTRRAASISVCIGAMSSTAEFAGGENASSREAPDRCGRGRDTAIADQKLHRATG